MILDTFYLLFKSDSSQASKDIGDLDKKIEGLTEKGKKRTEQENKDLKELNKQRKEQNEALKETNSQYQNIAENILVAATAAFSFGALSKDFFASAENNSALAIQGKLLGQSARDIKAYGYAFESAGGDADTFKQQIQQTSDALFHISGHVPKIKEVIAFLRESTRIGREEAIATGDTTRFNLDAERLKLLPGARPFFLLPDNEAAKSIEKFQQITANTEAAAAASRDYAKSWVELKASYDKFLSDAEVKILPTLGKLTTQFAIFLRSGLEGIYTPEILKRFDIQRFKKDADGKIVPAGKPTESYRSSSESVFESPEMVAQRKLANGGTDPYANSKLFDTNKPTLAELEVKKLEEYMVKGKSSLSVADTTPFGAGAINNTATQNSKQFNIKTGDIHVNTHADNVTGIASGIANELAIHLRAAAANLDDGVAY